MPRAHTRWTVLAHTPLTPLADNLWLVTGDVPNMQLKRTMTVARMLDGRLVIHSAIALELAEMSELERLGTPAFLVVPNSWHRLDAASFKARYPAVKVICPKGAHQAVAKVVAVDGHYEEFPADGAVTLHRIDGIKPIEGVMRVNSSDGVTLIFNDLLFNLPHQPGLAGLIFRALGSTGGPKVTRIMRLFAVKSRAQLAAHLRRLADIDGLVRLVPGHGRVIDEDAPGVLRDVARALGGV